MFPLTLLLEIIMLYVIIPDIFPQLAVGFKIVKKGYGMKENILNSRKALLILWGALLVTSLLIFKNFIFGNELFVFNDISSDTRQQYLMHYNSIVNHLRNGNFSLWDFNNGYGVSMFGLNLFDPFLIVLYGLGALFGPQHLAYYLVYLLLLEILLAGTACWYYLGQFDISGGSRLIAAFVYGLNGYLLIWGQHYQFGAIVVFLPVLFLLIEKTLKKKKFSLLLAFFTCVLVMYSLYLSYMSLLAAGIYLCVRLLFMDSRKDEPWMRGKLLAKDCGSMLLGVGMGMAVLLPTAAYILNVGSRLGSQQNIIQKFFMGMKGYESPYYTTLFHRLFSTSLDGISTGYRGYANYFEAPVLFFSGLLVILGIQFLFTIHRQQIPMKKKVMQYLIAAIIAFGVLVVTGSLVFNAFAYPFSRHTFLFMPLFALMVAWSLDRIFLDRIFSYIGEAAALVLLVLVYREGYKFWAQLQERPYMMKAMFLLGVTAVVLTFVVWLGYQQAVKIPRMWIYGMLLVLLMGNVFSEYYYSYKDKNSLEKEDPQYFDGLYGDSIQQALAYLRETDKSFYRVEKDYEAGTTCMDGMASDYRGISTYNSTQNKYIVNFVENLWPNLIWGDRSHYTFRQVFHDNTLLSLSGVKYVLSKNGDVQDPNYEMMEQFGDIYIYKNRNAASFGKLFTQAVSRSDYEAATSREEVDKDLVLSQAVVTEGADTQDLQQPQLDDYQWEEISNALAGGEGHSISWEQSQEETLVLNPLAFEGYERIKVELDFTASEPVYMDFTTLDQMPYTHFYLEGGRRSHIVLRIPKGARTLSMNSWAGTIVNGRMDNISFYGSKEKAVFQEDSQVEVANPEKDSLVKGKVDAVQKGILMLPIPYEQGWTVEVDGSKEPMILCDYGFIGFRVDQGSHDFTLRYQAPWLKEGVWASAASWAAFLVLAVILRKKRGRRV